MSKRQSKYHDSGSLLLFTLNDTIPKDQSLVLNTKWNVFSHAGIEEGRATIFWQTCLADSEMSLLRPLLENYPHYTPYEHLFASFYSGKGDEEAIARAREHLAEAEEYGTWDNEMRPIRNVMSRLRQKLQEIGMDVRSMLETGYVLFPPGHPQRMAK